MNPLVQQEHDSQDDSQEDPALPVCSVLNTVVDFVMRPPSPLEYNEFQQATSVEVPVLRVFGPILRRDTTRGLAILPHPVQSACLYIHNAFPYLLARPVAAGPDGSNLPSKNGHINWDSVADIERVAPVLMETLEAAIQASFQDFGTAEKHDSRKRMPVIRRVTVVQGRGFYTYCPGPSAPFLRVEYYNPALRWKVKRELERGLEGLPSMYYPDNVQYDCLPQNNEPNLPLQFHCYEAHIPYTMQFFKDYNLAGMSYIHLSDKCGEQHNLLRFRDPLPKKAILKSQVDESFLFVESNTPDSYRWQASSIVVDEKNSIPSQEDDPICMQQPSQSDPSPAHRVFTIKKETSCALELDVSVESILNIFSVITDVDEEEKETVHWRAVPSLREIWQEERRRMAKLVPPSDDFLSQELTLNVKRGAAKPGARLAVKGMRDLVNVTDGLYDNFQRVLKEIIERHSGAIQRMDDSIRQGPAVTPFSKSERLTSFTPSNDEALEDLGALGELFGDPSSQSQSTASASQDQCSIEILSSQFSQNDTPLSQSDQRLRELSQSYYDFSQRQIDDCDLTEFELSQRVERGEGIVVNGPYEELDDFIDPQTLRPYDDTGEDEEEDGLGIEEMSEDQMEKELSDLATQSLIQVDNMPTSYSPSLSLVEKLVPLDCQIPHEESRDASAEMSSENIQEKAAAIQSSLDAMKIPCKLTLQRRPPTREEAVSGGKVTGLYAMHAGNHTPEWMRYLHLYNRRKESSYKFAVSDRNEKYRFHLVHQPPNREAVQRWHRERQKEAEKNVVKERDPAQKSIKDVATGLPLDGNSRKLVVTARSMNTSVEEAEVEEADWVDDIVPQSTRDNDQYQTRLTQTTTESALYHDTPQSATPTHDEALQGIGNQGGRLWVEGGGELKAKTGPFQINTSQITQTTSSHPYLPSPVTLMVLEVHVQCRTGRAGVSDSKTISMTPDSERDKVSAVVYVFGKDPGGGEALETLERGCIFVPVGKEVEHAMSGTDSSPFESLAASVRKSMPREILGVSAPLSIESVRDERQLLLRIASIIRLKDPDMLLSWDTQGLGTGYLIERGLALGKEKQSTTNTDATSTAKNVSELDLARLFGRTPTSSAMNRGKSSDVVFPQAEAELKAEVSESGKLSKDDSRWKGSGLGAEWDDRVGAGVAAASVVGRMSFAVWKIVAEEVKHPNASYLPAVVSSVLNKRIPFHDNLKLSEWYGYNNGKERWRVLHHRLVQATCSLLLFDALDMIGRSGEAARLSGVEFSQSFPGIRGSQYKVEGVLLRALRSLNANERGSKKGRRVKPSSSMPTPSSLSSETKSQSQSPWKARRREREMDVEPCHNLSNRSYFFYSPSLKDSDKQEALEVQALTLEPQSGHHRDPIVVCDFTALYPSLVIAYNLCYSTCAGRLDYHSTRSEMRMQGKTKGNIGPFHYGERRSASVFKHHIRSLDSDKSDRAYVAPTGTVFVSEEVVKGVLPQVLDEMLSTRAMLKKAAKIYKKNVPGLSPSILRQLEARQLALKYVANVTYGYTSATFSGRCAMPLLADTIVECARRTLNNAINLANRWGRDSSGKWFGCEVLYGDTDSVFVKLPGRSVQEGFQFGEEFCAAVTRANPPPVQLKLEKVYLGCILQTKKKYCGMKFESKDQTKPIFEAKGLETIRRDQCPLTQKVLRNCLITLFQRDALAVKEYLYRQWNLILAGQLPVSDFVLTGRVRSKYRGGRVGPVQAVLARRLSEADPGRLIRHKERLSYVIVATPGKSFRLRDCVLTPMELLEQWDAYTIHAGYYITKHLNAALQRCLGLAPHHINVLSWYEACPKPRRRIHFWPITKSGNSIMISAYFGSDICFLCQSKCASQGTSRTAICKKCRDDPVNATFQTVSRLREVQETAFAVAKRCAACNLCREDASTFAQSTVSSSSKSKKAQTGIITPLANCSCIDCPLTYERHSLREAEIEATAACEALGID